MAFHTGNLAYAYHESPVPFAASVERDVNHSQAYMSSLSKGCGTTHAGWLVALRRTMTLAQPVKWCLLCKRLMWLTGNRCVALNGISDENLWQCAAKRLRARL